MAVNIPSHSDSDESISLGAKTVAAAALIGATAFGVAESGCKKKVEAKVNTGGDTTELDAGSAKSTGSETSDAGVDGESSPNAEGGQYAYSSETPLSDRPSYFVYALNGQRFYSDAVYKSNPERRANLELTRGVDIQDGMSICLPFVSAKGRAARYNNDGFSIDTDTGGIFKGYDGKNITSETLGCLDLNTEKITEKPQCGEVEAIFKDTRERFTICVNEKVKK